MFMPLVSLMTERTVRNDTAMTGEISLRGLVLPVGGIKEKVVAAHRAGIKRVMLPARNESWHRPNGRPLKAFVAKSIESSTGSIWDISPSAAGRSSSNCRGANAVPDEVYFNQDDLARGASICGRNRA
jgi:hypothetical protein